MYVKDCTNSSKKKIKNEDEILTIKNFFQLKDKRSMLIIMQGTLSNMVLFESILEI